MNSVISKTPIAVRVGAISILALLPIFTLAATYIFSATIVDREIERQVSYTTMNELASEAYSHAVEMRRTSKSFLLIRDRELLDAYHQHVESAKTHLSELATQPGIQLIEKDVTVVREGLDAHAAVFQELTDANLTMGLTEKEGLRGSLRSAVHAVEKQLNEANLENLTIKMLMMRRHEKDFMLRGDAKYVGRVDKRRSEFDELLKASSLSAADKQKNCQPDGCLSKRFSELRQSCAGHSRRSIGPQCHV